MPESSIWPLLCGNESEQQRGLEIAKARFARKPTPSLVMQLGVAYLWLYQYQSAWEHFNFIIKDRPKTGGDSDFGMAGVAKWCLGEQGEAISIWKAGLRAKYARSAGMPVRMPLLLFFASVVKPELYERRLAEELLLNVTKDARITAWPGPIARRMLGHITEAEIVAQCRGRTDNQTATRCWLLKFYEMVFEQSWKRNSGVFKEGMGRISDTSGPEWAIQDVFVHRIWCEEFFLGRYEGTK